MSETATPIAEPVEAVIISGPRKGDIIALPDLPSEVHAEEWALLDEALDGLLAAIERVATRVRSLRGSLQERQEVP